jgi:zinc protease
MRYILFSLSVVVFLLAGCSPKTGEKSAVGQESFRNQPPKPGPAPKIEVGDYERFTLDNGLEVIVVENHKLPRVSFQVFVDAPEVQEGELAGFIDMAGQMLMRGTDNRTKAEIDQAVDFMGASLSSSSSGLFGSCLTKHKEGLLDIMSDVLLNPAFPEEEFEKVKKQTLSGLALSKDDPNTIASNVGQVLRFGKEHPYGNIQTEQSTEKIALEVCKSYYEAYFRPNISYLVVVGDITVDEAKSLAQKHFGSWTQAKVAETFYDMPQKPKEARVAFVPKEGAVQSVIQINYPVDLQPGTDEAIKAYVLNTLLGGYFNSRLNLNLREGKGYTYGARSSLSPDELAGEFRAYASVRNEVTDSSMMAFLEELNKIRTELVTEDELQIVKNYITGSFARSLESSQTIARFALNTARYDLPQDYYTTYLEKVASVTREELLALAKKYVTPDEAYLLVVGNKKEVAETLTQFDADGEIEMYNYFGEPIEESNLEIPEGVTAQTIISDYLMATAGDKLDQLKGMRAVMTAETPMGAMEMKRVVQEPGQLLAEVAIGGNVMQKQVLNGEKGAMVAMGQSQPIEGDELKSMQMEAYLFGEKRYLAENSGYELSLEGIEKVEGTDCYKIVVTDPMGESHTDYYAVETSLKIRETAVREGNGQTITMIQDYLEYADFDGVTYPKVIQMSGMMPMPMKMEMQSVEWNPELDESTFQVD